MRYTLAPPNYEVKRSFTLQLFDMVDSVPKERANHYLEDLIQALREEEIEEFFLVLWVFFAQIPYSIQIQKEKYFQSVFYILFTLLGLEIHAEIQTNRGRIDAVIELEEQIYVFEFKLEDSKESALEQIKKKKYYSPYLKHGKSIYLVGVSFQRETKEIEDYLVEKFC